MTHKMASDKRGWKQATVCGVDGGYPTSLSRFDRHITCPDCLKHPGYRVDK